MSKYEIIFEALQSKVNLGELTIEDAEVINNLAYEKYVVEKKTTSQYRLEKFKKAHDFNPKDNTIKIGDDRVKFQHKGGSNKRNKLPDAGVKYQDGGIIRMGNSSFNRNNCKAHEFYAGHEYGHIKRVKLKAKNNKDLKNTEEFISKEIDNSGKDMRDHGKNPSEYTSDFIGKSISNLDTKTVKKILKNDKKTITSKDYQNKLKQTTLDHNDYYNTAKSYIDESNAHIKSMKSKVNEYKKKLKDYQNELIEAKKNNNQNKITTIENEISLLKRKIKNNNEDISFEKDNRRDHREAQRFYADKDKRMIKKRTEKIQNEMDFRSNMLDKMDINPNAKRLTEGK